LIYCFDVDDTLCETPGSDYEAATPIESMIKSVNHLYGCGHYIKIFTARGCNSGKDWTDYTAEQLDRWGLKYHELIMNKKPHYDLLIDDKAINVEDWKRAHGIKS